MYHRPRLFAVISGWSRRCNPAFHGDHALSKFDDALIKTITGPVRENDAGAEPSTHHVYR